MIKLHSTGKSIPMIVGGPQIDWVVVNWWLTVQLKLLTRLASAKN